MARPGNNSYYSGPVHTQRVQDWRRSHPGYWRRDRKKREEPGGPNALVTVLDEFALRNTCDALQNTCAPQLIALLGLITRLQGTTLQNIIAGEMRANMVAGYALLGIPSPQAKTPESPNT
jgi:hypothetical protein